MRKLLIAGSALCAPFLLMAACGGDSNLSACKKGQVFDKGKCFDDLGVAVNGVGFLPNRPKYAVFGGTSAQYEVIEADSGKVVMQGKADGPLEAIDTEQIVYRADFSELTKPGTYLVKTEDGKKSATFQVGESALEDALELAMLGMYGQRCGVDIDFEYGGERYVHSACHLAEASLEDEGGGTADDTGGWHDAGDYGKYVVNGAFAVAFLVAAYEHFPEYLKDREFRIPEAGDDVPDMLDEARVELEWILKTQFEDGSFSHKVTARGFEGEVLPENDRQPRYFYTASTSATGNAVGALAQAARVYAEFDEEFADTCLEAARRGQAFLDAHQENIKTMQTPNGTGTYDGGEDTDSRIWALAELWETTGEGAYLEDLEPRLLSATLAGEFDWANSTNLGIITYLRSKREGRDPLIVEKFTASLALSAQYLHNAALKDVYGRDSRSYYWGTNGVILRTSFNLAAANALFSHTDFLDTISLQLGHVFGLNGFARSYVTQLGPNPVVAPHHRPSQADGAGKPWPGLIIGGPHGQGSEERGTTDVPPALDWSDEQGNYYHNEIAINWNTALIYALVAALATQEDKTAECWPDDCFAYPEPDAGAGGGGGQGGSWN